MNLTNVTMYRAFSRDGMLITSSSSLHALIHGVNALPDKIEHWSESGIHLGDYRLARPRNPLLNDEACYDYTTATPATPADEFIDPYDAHADDTPLQVRTASKKDIKPQPLPPLHNCTASNQLTQDANPEQLAALYAQDRAKGSTLAPSYKPVGRYISIIELQAIALSIQLQIRAQRKQDEALYSTDTITEHEWKARRHANTVLSNTVNQVLTLAEFKAIVLDTPASKTNIQNAVPHAAMCGCLECNPADIV